MTNWAVNLYKSRANLTLIKSRCCYQPWNIHNVPSVRSCILICWTIFHSLYNNCVGPLIPIMGAYKQRLNVFHMLLGLMAVISFTDQDFHWHVAPKIFISAGLEWCTPFSLVRLALWLPYTKTHIFDSVMDKLLSWF